MTAPPPPKGILAQGQASVLGGERLAFFGENVALMQDGRRKEVPDKTVLCLSVVPVEQLQI